MPTRRDFVLSAGGLLLSGIWTRRLPAVAAQPITVYKSRTCGCCAAWVDHLRANGFSPEVHDRDPMDPVKDRLKVPAVVRSCHTGLVGGYLIEGHVPAEDIHAVLRERPKIMGLAVPGMPAGTPGMAQSEAEVGNFSVLAFNSDGSSRTFAQH
jgi:hypothetical protein